jgi:hypothetical protein
MLQPEAYFVILNQLPAVRLFNALPDGCTKTLFLLQQAERSIFDEVGRVGAFVGSDKRQLSFLLRGELDYHDLNVKAALVSVNQGDSV